MIQIKNLYKKFGATDALKEINAVIAPNSIFGLVGPNGSGKSTLLRTLSGVYRPDDGEILINGEAVFEHPLCKEKVFFVADDPYFFGSGTLTDMRRFYKGLYQKWDDEKYKSLCKELSISRQEKVSNFSKGRQKQAALILALSSGAEYLFFDEIFDGIDPLVMRKVKRLLIREVSEKGTSIIIASHNLKEIEQLCDHIGLLHNGRLLLQKEIDEIRSGIFHVQAAYSPFPSPEFFDTFHILKSERHGSMINLVIKGEKEDILKRLDSINPIFLELLPLSLEEVFISEMEVAGYDDKSI